MKKIDFETLKPQDYKILKIKEHSSCVLEKDGIVYKLFQKERLKLLEQIGINVEKKILYANKLNLKSIALPTGIIYENDKFIGYTMNKINGICYSNVLYNQLNLYDYAQLYEKFEQILEQTSEDNIIITDFANPGNIYFKNPNNIFEEIVLLDYDDMQIGKYRTTTYSSNIDSTLKDTPKYSKKDLYTKELNKLSLLYFYFNDVLCFSLKLLERDMQNIYENFKNACYKIGLNEKNIIEELFKIYKQNEKNPNLSTIFYEIANTYTLEYDDEERNVLIKK